MPSEPIEDRVRRIVAEFTLLQDAIDRYRRLIEMGDALPVLEPQERREENRLPGCQYAVWLGVTYDRGEDALRFRVDSDARIVRGLAALIFQVVDGQSPRAILAADFGFLDTIGVRSQLSVHRGNGLAALIEEIRRRARLHAGDGEAAA
jgi:cysteine desulfuration protein SufE